MILIVAYHQTSTQTKPIRFRKKWNFESCNSAENRSSKGKVSKVEENNFRGVCEINNLEILNWKYGFSTGREFSFINNSELG